MKTSLKNFTKVLLGVAVLGAGAGAAFQALAPARFRLGGCALNSDQTRAVGQARGGGHA